MEKIEELLNLVGVPTFEEVVSVELRKDKSIFIVEVTQVVKLDGGRAPGGTRDAEGSEHCGIVMIDKSFLGCMENCK